MVKRAIVKFLRRLTRGLPFSILFFAINFQTGANGRGTKFMSLEGLRFRFDWLWLIYCQRKWLTMNLKIDGQKFLSLKFEFCICSLKCFSMFSIFAVTPQRMNL